MPRIFISYRRGDSGPYAAWLYERLSARFGKEAVFMDVQTITPGEDFVRSVEGQIASCDVLIAMIGESWLTVADGQGRRRLDDPDDYVRREIAAALDRNIRVVPLLVEAATMPRPEALPKALEPLAQRQALSVTSRDFDQQVRSLIRLLEGKRRSVRWLAAVVAVAAAALVTSVTFDRPLPLRRWMTRGRLVVVMDSRLLVYGAGTQDQGRTTYDDIYDILHDFPGFKLDIRQEATYPTWRRENHLHDLNPDLIIIHAS